MDALGVFSALALGGSFGGLVGIAGGVGMAKMLGAEMENLIIAGGAAGTAMGGSAAAGGAIGAIVMAPATQNGAQFKEGQDTGYVS